MSELLMHPMGGGTGSDDVTATAANVLAGKTAVTHDSDDEAIEGTMPNNGAMNVTLTPGGSGSTSQAVAGGYYSGGTITADGSAAYSSGHGQGVTDADARVNTASASYKSGYNSGYSNGQNSVRTGGGRDRGDNGSGGGDGNANMASESIWIPRCVAAIVMMNGTGNGEYPPAIFLSSGSLLTQRIFGDQDCTVFVIVNCTSAQTATLRGAYHRPVYFLTTIGEY